MATVHYAYFMCQPGEASPQAYAILLATRTLFDGPAKIHILDWGSSNIHRTMTSTLACERSATARAFDRGSFARPMIYDIEQGPTPRLEIRTTGIPDRRAYWESSCHYLPMVLGTYCKSLYGVCNKSGSFPAECRVTLDILDVR